MVAFIKRLMGIGNDTNVRRIQPLVARINALEPSFTALTDDQLREKTAEFRKRLGVTGVRHGGDSDAQGAGATPAPPAAVETLDDLLPEAFAAVREAARRAIGMRHYDVQLIGGIVLHRGQIAEMRTGEGKTFVASLPLYLNALVGNGCHLITPNDYLSRVGGGWMGPVYYRLGMTTGVICHEFAGIYSPHYTDPTPRGDDRLMHWEPVSRRDAYHADITYGTNHEFGFDYLRDNMVYDLGQMVQRDLHYAIVDEVDNILIDEARTPLIISGPADEPPDTYAKFASIVTQLREERDFTIDLKARSVMITEEGIDRVERLAGVSNLYAEENYTLVHYLEQALRAGVIFRRDRDYVLLHQGQVLTSGQHHPQSEIVIVDEFTGRLMPGRRYSEGLHQAIEAKEGVAIRRENLTLATITFQNYFRLYRKLSGMTGTATTEAEEFRKIYNLEVIPIPTNRPMVRQDSPDLIFRSATGKYSAILEEIEEMHEIGRPVLVGTTSVEKSEDLSRRLRERGIVHQVLNAKYHETEASIIALAGRHRAVTIATNMAGRGTDIILGTADDLEGTPEVIRDLGGLHIIGTERHESRRIDNQLRGRAGRQGDPGSSRFYLSLEDDLMRRFGSDRIIGLMERLGLDDDAPIEHSMVSRSIEQAQQKVEGFNFDIRKHTVEYDDVMNTQRKVIYSQRRQVLGTRNPKELILLMARDLATRLIEQHTQSPRPDEWDLEAIHAAFANILGPELEVDADELHGRNREDMAEIMQEWAEELYGAREARYSPDLFGYAVRGTMLRVIDGLWQEHLTAIDDIIAGIGLRAYGQRDPLTEYKGEAYRLFQTLVKDLQANIVATTFRIQFSMEAVPNQAAQEEQHIDADPETDDQSQPQGLAPVTPSRVSPAAIASFTAPPKSMARMITNKPVDVETTGIQRTVSTHAEGPDGRPMTRSERNRQEALARRARQKERKRGG